MEKLFQEFPPIQFSDWVEQLKKDLKDKPLDLLQTSPEMDLSFSSYYHPVEHQYKNVHQSILNNFHRKNNTWSIRRIYSTGENQKILRDLNEGIDAVSLPFNNDQQFNDDSKDILFEHIVSDIKLEDKNAALSISPLKYSSLNFDVIAINAITGNSNLTLADFKEFYDKTSQNKNIWISGYVYGDAGASTIQELGNTLSHLNEYLQYLTDQKETLQTINNKIVIELSVTDNYFVNIAKFRAIRELVRLLFNGYDQSYAVKPITIYAQTSVRFLAENDHNNNFLRQTTQAMSAILGGCDALTIIPLKGTKSEENELNERMAKNIQLVLRDESYLDKVIDVSAGSMFIESLTDQLIEKAWQKFLAIEKNGGLITSLKKGIIQQTIKENREDIRQKIQQGKKTFLGVNKFPSNLEQWNNLSKPESSTGYEFEPLSPFKAEYYFEPKSVNA